MLSSGGCTWISCCLAEQRPSQTKALELPKEHEMKPKDKYTVFTPHAKGYRKGIHKVPKWTRVRRKILNQLPHIHHVCSSHCEQTLRVSNLILYFALIITHPLKQNQLHCPRLQGLHNLRTCQHLGEYLVSGFWNIQN